MWTQLSASLPHLPKLEITFHVDDFCDILRAGNPNGHWLQPILAEAKDMEVLRDCLRALMAGS